MHERQKSLSLPASRGALLSPP